MLISQVVMTIMAFILGYLFSQINTCKKCKQFGNTEQLKEPSIIQKVFEGRKDIVKEEPELPENNPFYQ